MWLINTTTLKLEEHLPSSVEYAILSHTWEAGEVTFRDMADLDVASQRAGYAKILKTCEIAKSSGIQWAWVDTCCIDKSSSAELTESINSMFRWYQEACICYAFLSDLPTRPSDPNGSTGSVTAEDLSRCRWFARGWTLQELLAPSRIVFYDIGWNERGSKRSLGAALSLITGIDRAILSDVAALPEISVARRMFWAARRQTTREEDRAYSLFGVFDVNLPLIYGEGGEKAFLRLQEAILQSSTDLSLFAWEQSADDDRLAFRGLLAKSPDEFADCGHIRPMSDAALQQVEIRLSNKGIHFSPDIIRLSQADLQSMPSTETSGLDPDAVSVSSLKDSVPNPNTSSNSVLNTLVVKLNHYWVPHTKGPAIINPNNYRYVCLELFWTPDGFVRWKRRILHWTSRSRVNTSERREVHVPRHLTARQSRSVTLSANHAFKLSFDSPFACTYTSGFPGHLWYQETSTMNTKGQTGFVGTVSVRVNPTEMQLDCRWYYPEFRVFFGIGRPGMTVVAHTSSVPPPSAPSDLPPLAWVYIPSQADLYLGRSATYGGDSQSSYDDPDGLRHLIQRAVDPKRDLFQYDLVDPFPVPAIVNSHTLSGPLLLQAELKGESSQDSLHNMVDKASLEVSAKVESQRFPDGMTEHRLRIVVRHYDPHWPWSLKKDGTSNMV